jgi:hypothetical protein
LKWEAHIIVEAPMLIGLRVYFNLILLVEQRKLLHMEYSSEWCEKGSATSLKYLDSLATSLCGESVLDY